MPNLQDIVRVRNAGTLNFRGKTAPDQIVVIPPAVNEDGTLNPRGEGLFSFEMACMFLGKPDITDPRQRTERLDQLRSFYGVYDNREAWDHDNAGRLFDEDMDPHHKHPLPVLPRLEVYDLTSNERVFMLLDDPDGTAGLTAAPLPPQDQAIAILTAQIAKLQMEQQAMMVELSRHTGAQSAMTPPPSTSGESPNQPISQAPVVTGVQPEPPLLVDGEPIEPGYQPDGSLLLANGVVIPAPNSAQGQQARYKAPVTPLDPEDLAKVRAGQGTAAPTTAWVPADPATLGVASEDTPRAARV